MFQQVMTFPALSSSLFLRPAYTKSERKRSIPSCLLPTEERILATACSHIWIQIANPQRSSITTEFKAGVLFVLFFSFGG